MSGLIGYIFPGVATTDAAIINRACLPDTSQADFKNEAALWRISGESDRAQALWQRLVDAWGEPVRVSRALSANSGSGDAPNPMPDWCHAVLELLLLSDAACAGLGLVYSDDANHPFAEYVVEVDTSVESGVSTPEGKLQVKNAPTDVLYETRLEEFRSRTTKTDDEKHVVADKRNSSLTSMVHKDILTVLPKGRISQVGSSVRSLTQNLALSSAQGSVRCSWQQLEAGSEVVSADEELFNILMIPLPYRISKPDFKGRPLAQHNIFEIEQTWISTEKQRENVIRKTIALLQQAKKKGKSVNVLMFPEYALNYSLFSDLLNEIKAADIDTLEYIIAGSSSNCDGEKANFVLTAVPGMPVKSEASPDDSAKRNTHYHVVSQRKHHRWKLCSSQIKGYGLEEFLPSPDGYWEAHGIETRELNFFQFRKDAFFTSLICEDLARSEPCHGIIRAVGPHLVFALLMDGPQLASRWPKQYGATLSDDPGCAVLTFTSSALVHLSNEVRAAKGEPTSKLVVGLFNGPGEAPKELYMKENGDAILLQLRKSRDEKGDRTIDARSPKSACNWTYERHCSISL